jgi:hypothetical protein
MFSPELYQLCTLWNNQIEHIGMRKKMFTSEIMCLRGKKIKLSVCTSSFIMCQEILDFLPEFLWSLAISPNNFVVLLLTSRSTGRQKQLK